MKQMLLLFALAVGLEGIERNPWTGHLDPNKSTERENMLHQLASVSSAEFQWDVPQPLADKDTVREFDSVLPIESSIESVWEVLTDYDNIEKFQPGIEESGLRPLLPDGAKQLEQTMVQRFLIFKKRLHLVLRIVEKPPHRIEFSIIEGDFKTYDGAWVIDPNNGEPRLRLVIRIEPDFSTPGPVLDYLVRSSGEKSLLSVLKEAERREK